MASKPQNKEYKRDDLGTPVEEMFAGWTDSDDETNIKSSETHTTPGLIHVIKGYSSNPNSSNDNNSTIDLFNQIPKMKSLKQIQSQDNTQQPSSIPLDTIVSSLFDMKTYIKNQSKIAEFEHLIDLLLLKFNEMQAEKFNLLQQINNLEKENDNLYIQQTKHNHIKTNNNNNNNIDNDTEFKEVLFTDGLENEQSVILVDYWTDNNINKNKKDKQDKKRNDEFKSSIAPWTKYFNRHKQGIGEDLRIAIISSQKLQDISAYNDQYFDETLQNIKIKCYFPKLFAELRALYNINLNNFLSSFKANHLLEINKTESSLSGSQFFYSFDGKYIIKSMRREEVTFIKQMIYKYYKYIENNKCDSFITKFYAMFKIINTINDNNVINAVNKMPQHFIIMNCIYYENNQNININGDIQLNIYDIKGSEYNRITEKQNLYEFHQLTAYKNKKYNNKSISILKDHEWMEKGTKLDINDDEKKQIQIQLFKDIQFLKSLQIMDYSLIIALYDDKNNNNNSCNKYKGHNNKNYFIGIIDFLQHYDIWKQVEGNGAYYILGIEGYDIVDPQHYANRLWKFITTYIL